MVWHQKEKERKGTYEGLKTDSSQLHIKQAWIREKAAWTDGNGSDLKKGNCMDVMEFFIFCLWEVVCLDKRTSHMRCLFYFVYYSTNGY